MADMIDDTFSIQNVVELQDDVAMPAGIVDENLGLLSNQRHPQGHLLHSGPEWMRGTHGFLLACLILIFLSGMLAGTYLLLEEGKEEIVHDDWYRIVAGSVWKVAHADDGNSTRLSATKRLKLPATKVFFIGTSTENCDSESRCLKLVQEIQLKHVQKLNQSDILYNFIVTGDGAVYEGRGWNFQSEIRKDALVVAFTSTSEKTVTWRQRESAKLLLELGVVQGKVVPCYKVYSPGTSSTSLETTANFIKSRNIDCESSGNG